MLRVSLEESIGCPGPTSHTYPEAQSQEYPMRDHSVFTHYWLRSFKVLQSSSNLPWCKSVQRKTPLCILAACIYLMGYKEAFFFFLSVKLEQWSTERFKSQWSLQTCTTTYRCVQFVFVLYSTKQPSVKHIWRIRMHIFETGYCGCRNHHYIYYALHVVKLYWFMLWTRQLLHLEH